MQPILLRSAVVVGIGAAMAAALANGAFMPELQTRPIEEAAVLIVEDEPVVQNEPAEAPAATGPATGPNEANAAPLPAAPAMVTAPPAPPPPAASASTSSGVAGEPALANAPRLAAPPATAAPGVPANPSGGTGESAAEPATVGSLPPTECLSGSAAGTACPQTAALVPEPGDPAPQPGGDEAGSEQNPELAAVVPRIPKARPEPPPQPRRTARKANWPADDPPNCGSKRARWRYVNDVPTWYCR
ncbi:MAG TPA: hypothetical protein VN240_01150 [Propylenella sp.]|nr:hypothetical protein [Propylenella sp.]